MEKNKRTRILWAGLFACLATILIFLLLAGKLPGGNFSTKKSIYETERITTFSAVGTPLSKPDCSIKSQGTIAYITSQPLPASLYIMDGNGCNPREVFSDVSHTYGWRSSQQLATICNETTAICIIDVENRDGDYRFVDIEQFSLPKECIGSWVSSLDWSNDGERLLISCGRYFDIFFLIEISLPDVQEYRVILSSENPILRALWSPNNDRILLSIPPNIYTTDLNGENRIEIIDGIGPIWSSDGRKIIFIKTQDYSGSSGIAIVNSDGTGFEWIYISDKPVDLTCSELRPDCKLSLSPNGVFLVFNGLYYPFSDPGINYQIFRLDLISKKMEIISNYKESRFYSEPSWSR